MRYSSCPLLIMRKNVKLQYRVDFTMSFRVGYLSLLVFVKFMKPFAKNVQVVNSHFFYLSLYFDFIITIHPALFIIIISKILKGKKAIILE